MASKVSSTKKLVSASALMASGTLISRAMGLVRVMLIAFILGNDTRQADILALATMVPNSLYILFAGGALNTVLVPQIVRAIKHDPDGGEAYTNRIMTAFMLIVGAVAVVVTIGAPVVTHIYSSDAWRVPELADQYASMVMLTYLTLPQVFFYGAFFLLGQVLNARDRFGPMMWAPIANNVISVLVLSTYLFVWGSGVDTSAAFTTPQLLVLGIGSTVGIASQTAVLIPYLRMVGFKFRPRFDLRGTGLGHTFSLTKWTLGFVAVNQLALLIVTRLATSATAGGAGGGVDVYSKAHLIWILPHSLITVSLTTAMLPNASRLAAAEDMKGVAEEATKTMRMALIALVPATVGFIALATPIAGLLFGRGQGVGGAPWIAWALVGFAIGLIPFTVQFVCLRTYYALENTRTPFLLQVVIAAANAGFAILFVWLVTEPGLIAGALALSYSVAYFIGVFLSWRQLTRQVPQLQGGAIMLHIARLLISASVGGVVAYVLAKLLVGLLGAGTVGNAVAILAGLAVIAVVYFLGAKLFHVREFHSLSGLMNSILRRRGGKPAAPAAADAEDEPEADAADHERKETQPDLDSLEADDATGSFAAGLTEDLMPTQLTSAVIDDSEAADIILPGADEDASEELNQPQHAATPIDSSTSPGHEAPGDDATTAEDSESDSGPGTTILPASALPDAGLAVVGPTVPPTGADEVDETRINNEIDPEEPEEVPELICEPGTLLDTRYRVESLLEARAGIESWRVHDLVLSRDAVAHVLGPDDPRIDEVIGQARRIAVATDSRFLRVLDAISEEDSPASHGVGAYVICEYVAGRSLTDLLGFGALSTIEAAWIVRELADALTGLHSQGIFHEHLTPDNVIVTTNGDVRLVGFCIDSIAAPEERPHAWSEREALDVKGLGRILYAAMVQHWPGGPAFGLEAAPIIAGEPASPHIVRTGLSPTLDRIATVTLTERGSAADQRITTASQLAGALGEVLGTASPSADLEQRVEAAERADVTTSGDDRARTVRTALLQDTSTFVGPQAASPPHSASATSSVEATQEFKSDTAAVAQPSEPGSEPAVRTQPSSRRPVVWLIGTLLVAALIIWLVLSAINAARDDGVATSPKGSESAAASATDDSSDDDDGPYEIAAGIDFDPEADGGNDEENPDRTGDAFDGDPETGWPTMEYHNHAELGRLKPGVGLILDLGEAKQIREVDLLFDDAGTSVEIRVPEDSETGSAPMDSEKSWQTIASQDDAGQEVTLSVDEDTKAQFVMVYLTKLPEASSARYRGVINEVSVS